MINVRNYVGDRPRSSFKFIRYQDLPESARWNSEYWRSLIFLLDKLHGAPSSCVFVGVSLARNSKEPDLLEYIFPASQGSFRLVEHFGSITLQIPIDASQKTEDIRKYAESIIRLHDLHESPVSKIPDIVIPWPKELRDGIEFHSNDYGRWPMIVAWHTRVDFAVYNHALNITYYKSSLASAAMGIRDTKGFLSELHPGALEAKKAHIRKMRQYKPSPADPIQDKKILAEVLAEKPSERAATVRFMSRQGICVDDIRYLKYLEDAQIIYAAEVFGEPCSKAMLQTLARLCASEKASSYDRLHAAALLYRYHSKIGEQFLLDRVIHGDFNAGIVLATNRDTRYLSQLATLLQSTTQPNVNPSENEGYEEFITAITDWPSPAIAQAFKIAFHTRPTGRLAIGAARQGVSGVAQKIEHEFEQQGDLGERLEYAAALACCTEASPDSRAKAVDLLKICIVSPENSGVFDPYDSAGVYQILSINLIHENRILDAEADLETHMNFEDASKKIHGQAGAPYLEPSDVACQCAIALTDINYKGYVEKIHQLLSELDDAEEGERNNTDIKNLCKIILKANPHDKLVLEIQGPDWVAMQKLNPAFNPIPTKYMLWNDR